MALIRYFINVHLSFCTYDQEVTLITERYSICASYKFIDQSVRSFVCVETYHPSQQFFSHVGTGRSNRSA